MMVNAPLRFLPLLLACSLAAGSNCGGPVGDDDDDDEGEGEGGEGEGGEGEGDGEFPVTPEARELCEIYARGQIAFISAVAGAFSTAARCSVDDAPAFPDGAQFAAAAVEACADDANPVVQDFAHAVAGGRVTFNRANIDACSAFDFGAEQLPPECAVESLMVGNQGEGDVCDQDWDCTGALLCQAADIHVQALSCLPLAEAGDACLDAIASIGGVVTLAVRTCAADAECADFQCVAKAGTGQPCDERTCLDGLRCDFAQETPVCALLGDAGDPCSDDEYCAEGLACSPALSCAIPVLDNANCVAASDACVGTCSTCRSTTPGGAATTCQDRGIAGDGCAVIDDCRAGFVCDAAAGACVAGGVAGDACSDSEECAAGSVCAVSGTCVARPALGEPCDPNVTEECAEGSCAAGQCRAGGSGEPCDDDGDCVDGLLCTAAGQVCANAPTTGPCSIDGTCAGGFACDAGVCVVEPTGGEPCLSDESCALSFFCDAGNVCQPKRGAGELCAANEECLAACVAGECGAVGPSCNTSKGFFPLFVLLSAALPLRRLRRLYRDVRRLTCDARAPWRS
jgi:hypothetical protein